MNKFIEYSKKLFDRSPKPFTDREKSIHIFRMGAAKLKPIFIEKSIDFSDPPKPPEWIINDGAYFGSYLAGVIDGDGDVRIKGKYPECFIRISSGKKQNELRNSIIRNMNCGVHICKRSSTRVLNGITINGTWFELEFCVTKKNLLFFKNFIVKHIAINYKRDKIIKFIENRYMPPAGFEPTS